MKKGDKFSLILSLIMILSQLVIAQNPNKLSNEKRNKIDQDQEDYMNVFNQVMNDKEHSLLKHLYDIQPDKLPGWVYFKDSINFSNNYILGISDPGLDSATATNQAFNRAIALNILLDQSNFKNISDDYTHYIDADGLNDYETKYQDFSNSTTSVSINPEDFKIYKTHFTKYNEAVVLVEYNPDNSNDSLKSNIEITGEYLQSFIELDNGMDRIEFYNFNANFMNSENDSLEKSLQYNYKVFNKNFEIISKLNEEDIQLPYRSYNYTPNLQNDSIDFEDKLRFRLNKGLWNAYISSILYEMQKLGKEFPSQLKTSDDIHTQKAQGLVRNVSTNKLNFSITRFDIAKNVLLLELSAKIVSESNE